MDDETEDLIARGAASYMNVIGEAVCDVVYADCIKVEQAEMVGSLWLQAFVAAAKNTVSDDDFKTKFEDKLSHNFFAKPGTDPLDGIHYTSAEIDAVAEYGPTLWKGVQLGHNLATEDDASEAETFAWQNKLLADISSAAEEVGGVNSECPWCDFSEWPAAFKAKRA